MAKRSRRVEVHGFDEIDKFFEKDQRSWKDERDRAVEERFSPKPRRPIKPLTDKHRRYQKAIDDHEITLCCGPAGTGKTSLACEVAVRMLKAGTISRIVLTRPLVQCDEELGILPGDLKEKMDPYLAPLVESLKELLGAKEYSLLEGQGSIEICPLAVMRGKTYHNAFVIVDEAQNATYGQLKMVLSRLGHNSRLVVNGDIEQADLGMPSPLIEVWKRLAAPPRHPGYAFVVLGEDEVLRPEIVRFTTKRLSGRGGDLCSSTPTSATGTTSPPPEPAPSYAGAVTRARPSANSSKSSKKQAS